MIHKIRFPILNLTKRWKFCRDLLQKYKKLKYCDFYNKTQGDLIQYVIIYKRNV